MNDGNYNSEEITHAKSNGDAYFRLIKTHVAYKTWRCTHGAWSIHCYLDGTVMKSEKLNVLRGFHLVEYYTYDEYMEVYGKDNPYE